MWQTRWEGSLGENEYMYGFPGGSNSTESACTAWDLGSIPGSGRSPGEGNDYPLQYSCLDSSIDRGAWQATVHGICRTESLHCSPETTTTLLIIYTPIQNKKFKVWKKSGMDKEWHSQGMLLKCKRHRFSPWVGKISWRREWLPTPLFLPGEFHGQRSLEGYTLWGYKESDPAEQLTHFHF